jgi:hypothetical protein
MALERNMPAGRSERRGVSKARPIQATNEAVSTIDLADLLCGPGQMRRVGQTWTARCPHPDRGDKSPSFVVYPETDSWFCYGCLRGGDVIDLARFAWGYEKGEAGTAATMLLMEFGYEAPRRPQSWFGRQRYQKPIRDSIEDSRVEAMMRRLWLWIFEPILADVEDADERTKMGNELWAAVRPLVVRLIEDRRGTA